MGRSDTADNIMTTNIDSQLESTSPIQHDKVAVKTSHNHVEDYLPTAADLARLTEDAQNATDAEHKLTVREALSLYPRAMVFSFGVSLAIVMEGYDTGLLTNFYSIPRFRQQYGRAVGDGSYQLISGWQSALSAIPSLGSIIGLTLAGHLVERLGFRKSMAIGLLGMIGAIFVVFFSPNIQTLFVGEFLCGIPWGMFQGMASTYAADVAPITLRPLLTSYINLCWAMGQFLSTGVLKGVASRTDQWAYRIPFAVQWFWPIPIGLVLVFAPESPWWLMRKGRREDARHVLRKLASPRVSSETLNEALELMYLTNEHERQVQEGTAYVDLFKGTNLRRTEISAVTWICQVTCGIWFSSNITYFMQQAGFGVQQSFNLGLGLTAVSCVGTIASWFVTTRVGRRTLYLWGLVAMFATEMLVGILGIPTSSVGLSWASGGVLIINTLVFYFTVGPVCYTIVPEVPSVRLRNRTVSFSRASYNLFAIGANFIQAPMLNPTAWNLRGKGAFIWSAFCLISIVWVFFRLPETKGRTPAELDVLFENHTPTRMFPQTLVEPFRSDDFIAKEKMEK